MYYSEKPYNLPTEILPPIEYFVTIIESCRSKSCHMHFIIAISKISKKLIDRFLLLLYNSLVIEITGTSSKLSVLLKTELTQLSTQNM